MGFNGLMPIERMTTSPYEEAPLDRADSVKIARPVSVDLLSFGVSHLQHGPFLPDSQFSEWFLTLTEPTTATVNIGSRKAPLPLRRVTIIPPYEGLSQVSVAIEGVAEFPDFDGYRTHIRVARLALDASDVQHVHGAEDINLAILGERED